ncbi:MAG: VCBS repeat-containing protein, partial [Candidatus Delongbacteria bacterium]|nr:VCBS repeat-containing protein [Candidatus Delongbacteria bacterium]
GVLHNALSWGDCDNDGDPDLIITGLTGDLIKKTVLYKNNSGIFTDAAAGLTDLYYSFAAWGDYDNDGDLDILLAGYGGLYNYESVIYRNNSTEKNTIPTVPSNLISSVTWNDVNLSWNKSTDAQTLQNALTYNLMISTVPYGSYSNVSSQGTFNGTSWSQSVTGNYLFYYVVAVAE